MRVIARVITRRVHVIARHVHVITRRACVIALCHRCRRRPRLTRARADAAAQSGAFVRVIATAPFVCSPRSASVVGPPSTEATTAATAPFAGAAKRPAAAATTAVAGDSGAGDSGADCNWQLSLELDEVDDSDVPLEWKEFAASERASLGKSRDKWHVRFKLKFDKDKYRSCAENGSKDIYVVCAICAKAGVQTNVHKTGGGKKTPQRPLSIDNFKQTHCSRDMHVNAQSTLKSRSTAAPDEGGVGGASPAAETATAGAQTKKQKASVVTPHLSRDVCVGWLCRLPGGQLDRRAALPTLARAPVVPLSVPTPALTSPPLSLCPSIKLPCRRPPPPTPADSDARRRSPCDDRAAPPTDGRAALFLLRSCLGLLWCAGLLASSFGFADDACGRPSAASKTLLCKA